jgi:GAF domain-containing protein
MLEGDAPQARSQSELAAMMSELALSLEESISREKALSRVLKIISASEGDIDGVIASVLDYALELCDAEFGIVFDYKPQNVFRAAHARGIPKAFRDWFDAQGAFRVGADTGLGRLASRQTVVNIVDVRSEGVYRSGDPLRLATADLGGARSFTAIPMQAGDRLIGAFTIYRQRVHPFDDRSLQLANTFADQSVIAIENARMLSRLRSASGAHV